MTEAPLETNAIFGTPTWRFPVPEMLPDHSGIKAEPEKLWAAGYFGKHGSSYGHQTKEELFTLRNLENIPWFALLKKRFTAACEEILQTRHGHAKRLPFEIYCTQGGVLIQTNENGVEDPWHNHHPATLSGCYYLQVPQTSDPSEGL